MRIEIDGRDYSKYLTLPVTTQRTLNEELDTAVLQLACMHERTPIAPFTPAVFEEDGVRTHYFVAIDNVKELLGRRRYNHELTLIEETKITERILCEAKAFTQPLVKDYADGKTVASYSVVDAATGKEKAYGILDEGYLYSPMVYSGTLEIPLRGKEEDANLWRILGFIFVSRDLGSIAVYHSDVYGGLDERIYCARFNEIDISGVLPLSIAYDTGYYTLYITSGIQNPDDSRGNAHVISVNVVPRSIKAEPYSIEAVTNILLEIAEPLRRGLDVPRFTLCYRSEEQKRILQGTAAPPQLAFSNGRSLWENLREIGRIVHAIPRIEGSELYFDELGSSEYADLSRGRLCGFSESYNMADYTAALEANVSHLIDTDDVSSGTITEPFPGAELSLRTASESARIKDETGVIATRFPIERVTSLRFRFETKNGERISGDLTPYVFERNEYELLSSFKGGYPESKTYAIYYTQGARDLGGLWYRSQDSGSELIDSFARPAIVNVIASSAGVSVGEISDRYPRLSFEISYVTTVNARVRQHRVKFDGRDELVMAYNQSANKLSARAFGESLRGQIAMMGTTSTEVLYLFRRYSDVPPAGLLYDDENYIGAVTTRLYRDFCVSQLALSTGYNELGAYADVNNLFRQYEIPSGEERFTVLTEFVDLSSRERRGEDTAASSAVASIIARSIASPASVSRISVARVQTFDEGGTDLTHGGVLLPVVSYSIGGCLYFGFRFLDNYSAGKTSEAPPSDEALYRLQKDVPYGDRFYSRAETLSFSLYNEITPPDGDAERLALSHALPEGADAVTLGSPLVSLGAHPLIWHKDSADAGNVSYQLHFVSSDGFIVGSALARGVPLAASAAGAVGARMYFFDRRINELTGTSDERLAIASLPLSYVASDPAAVVRVGTPPASFKSWAILRDGEFLLGKNTSEDPGAIYINLRRKR